MLHFWLSCLIKSFWDSAAFLGTNKTGIWFTIIVGLLSLAMPISRHVKQYGWASFKSTWFKLIGEGFVIGIGAFILVWIGNLIAAPHGLYTEIEAQKKQASQQSEQRTKDLSDSFGKETKRLSGLTAEWQSKTAETKTDCAVKEGISQTLQKQNRDQQSTINGCLTQAMKMLTPESFKNHAAAARKRYPKCGDKDHKNPGDRKQNSDAYQYDNCMQRNHRERYGKRSRQRVAGWRYFKTKQECATG